MAVAVFGGVTAPGPLLALPDTQAPREHVVHEFDLDTLEPTGLRAGAGWD